MAGLNTNEILKERLSRTAGVHRLTEEETRRIKAIVLETAAEIVRICDELSIPWMLGGGSALGAVRHQGFIPWDDDIDLNIPRAYIDRLLDEVESRYPDKYYVEAPLRTPGYLSSFIQIHRKGTVFREYLVQKDEECGIKIDIFVIENTYDGILRRYMHGLSVQLLLFLLSCYRMFAWRDEFMALAADDGAARRTMRIKQLIGAPFALAPGRLYRRTQQCMQKCKDDGSRYVTIPSGRKHFFGELYERASFMQTLRLPFEGYEFAVTRDKETYLSRLYGNYMELPAEEKREHHVIYDLKFPGEYERERLLTGRETQELLCSMLDDFVAYCKRHGLRYYLVGGTLLGAVRHQGFIPWDDDIDVGMPRRDYERFLALAEDEPVGAGLAVVSGTRGTLGNPYCELIHTGTRLERDSSRYIRKECRMLHLFIDIFPQDGWPEDDGAARRLVRRMNRGRYLIQCGRARIGKGASLLRTLVKTPPVLFMRLYGYRRVIRRMDQKAKALDYDSCRYVGAVTYGIYGIGERCLRSEVTDFAEVSFEGKRYAAPGCYDRYLTQIFGDYRKLPPEDQQKSHGMRVWLSGN